MNKLSKKLEKMIGKYAISNLSFYLILCYGIGYVMTALNIPIVNYITLEPALILRGQIWRLVTWILIPPYYDNIFFVLISLYFYYSIGTALERVWGTYRYNLYIFSGMFFTIIGVFILYIIFGAITGQRVTGLGAMASTYYLYMSIYLAYAATFPDTQILLFFIIPIKTKVMGIIFGFILLLAALQGGWVVRIIILASFMNFLLFFFTGRKQMGYRMSPKQIKRRQEFNRQVKQATPIVTKHKCAICGRTDESHPDLEFRFCSKCEGNYEYCQDHLFTHKHIKWSKE